MGRWPYQISLGDKHSLCLLLAGRDHCARQLAGYGARGLSRVERHAVSFIYDILQDHGQVNMNCIKKDRERGLGIEIAEDIWDKSLKYVNICSFNARHCLIQFKILHRLHYSKVRLHKIFPEMSPVSEKCDQAEADLFYSYVLCPKLQDFCDAIFSFFSRIFKVQIRPDPLLVILGAGCI